MTVVDYNLTNLGFNAAVIMSREGINIRRVSISPAKSKIVGFLVDHLANHPDISEAGTSMVFEEDFKAYLKKEFSDYYD